MIGREREGGKRGEREKEMITTHFLS